MVWWSPHETSLSRMASSLTAGAAPAAYSGPHSKRTLSTTRDRGLVGGQLTAALTGSRHGKKTHSTRLGCRTTTTLTNGSGKRRRDNLLATSDSSRCNIRVIHPQFSCSPALNYKVWRFAKIPAERQSECD